MSFLCSDLEYSSLEGCDTYDFISSIVYIDNHTAPAAFTKVEQAIYLLEMTISNGGYDSLMRHMYNASFASASSIYGEDTNDIVLDATWRENAYAFCNGYCSIFAVNSFGDSLSDHSVSEFMHVLRGGACEDVLSMSRETYLSLVSAPPVELSEKYYECNTAPADAFNDAIGIASGNTSTIVPIVFMVLLPFIYLWITISGGIAKHEYEQEEKDDMRDQLILYLLRAKDGKVRSMKPNSPIVILANEIEKLREQMGGYPDSDDSASEGESSDDEFDDSSVGNGGVEMAHYRSHDDSFKSSNPRPSPSPRNRYAVAKKNDSEEWI